MVGEHRHPSSFPTRRSSDLKIKTVRRHSKLTLPSQNLRAIEPDAAQDFARRQPLVSRKQNQVDRKSTRLNSSHVETSYAVYSLKKTTQSTYSLVFLISYYNN